MNTRALKRYERIQDNIRMARNRLAVKEAYIPVLESSDLSPEMKAKYYQGIEEEKTYIASCTEILRVEYPQQ